MKIADIIEPVSAWFAENKRDLPWRKTRDPYRIWVSEIMLQQTRVEAVKPYYERFLKELPTVEALAACPEDRLMKLWEGLGYYSRARNLQSAARVLTERAGTAGRKPSKPAFPRTAEELEKLPGIGSYTAGALVSIAFDEPVPAADGNVFRILSRVTADEREIDSATVKREMTGQLAAAMREYFVKGAPFRPKDFNQGLMDLGATVCLPNAEPRCAECPLKRLCRAHKAKRETDFPKRAKKKSRRIEEKTILLIRDGERVVLAKRPEKGLLAGLYEFPSLPETSKTAGAKKNARGGLSKRIAEYVAAAGLEPLQIKRIAESKHIFSHIEWHMVGYEVRVAALDKGPGNGWILAEIGQIERDYPIPSAFAAYAEHLQMKHGAKAAREARG